MSNGTEASASPGLRRVKMRLFTVVVVIFTLTCGGSFGMEDVVGSSGPGLTLVLLLLIPIFWSLPMALVSTELGSALPEEGGFYRWSRRALGEFWGFQAGWWWQLSLFVDTSVYIALTGDYFKSTFGISSLERWLIGAGLILVFTYINIRGLDITGWVLTLVEVVVFLPFVALVILGFARGHANPFSPFAVPGQSIFTSAGAGLAVLMWMFSGYESMSMVAGEIEQPQKLIPKALLIDMVLVIGFYFLTTMAGVVAYGHWADFSTGGSGVSFITAGKAVGGQVLRYGLIAAMLAGNLGLFTSYLAAGSRPAYVLSKDKLFARWWSREHKKYGTPWVAILFMSALDAVFIIGSFSFLIVLDVFLLMFAYIVILISAVVLRRKEPGLQRLYRIPLNTWGLALFVAPPIVIAVYALVSNGWSYFVGGCVAVLSGPLAYIAFKQAHHGVQLRQAEATMVSAPEKIASLAPAPAMTPKEV
jgi:amino acid transporter